MGATPALHEDWGRTNMNKLWLGALAVATAGALSLPASAHGPATRVATDPAGDTYNSAGATTPNPRVDLLALDVSDTADTLTLALHVADLDADVDWAGRTPVDSTVLQFNVWMKIGGVDLGATAGRFDSGDLFSMWVNEHCSAPAGGAFDGATNTVTIVISLDAARQCGAPIGHASVITDFEAYGSDQSSRALVSTPLFAVHDTMTSAASYTLGR